MLIFTKKIIAMHQPNYIPWLGYFYKIFLSDIFVFADELQFSNSGMHQWHYVKTRFGILRLKIPVEHKFDSKINEVRTRDELGWKQKHLKTIQIHYSKTPYFKEIFSEFSDLLLETYPNLAIMNERIITHICEKFGMKTKFIESSSLNIYTRREQRVIDVVKALDGTEYYSGIGAKAYQREENFLKRGINLNYVEYKPFVYKQLWGNFEANVTILDYLMNCGYNWEAVIQSQKNN